MAMACIHVKTRSLAAPRVVYRLQLQPELKRMPSDPADANNGTIEECIDEIDEFIERLDRYPPPVLAFAMRAHLGSLLRAMVDGHVCTREHARQFVLELEHEALGVA
jgi:hypothetical protein